MKKTSIIIGILLILIAYFLLKPYYDFLTKKLNLSLIRTLFSLESIKTYDNAVSLVVLGIAGKNHDGPNLSDTIIVIHYNFKSNRLLSISIPRDIWSDTLGDKINTAYAYGESKRKGGGLALAKAEVGAIVGIPIHYGMVLDFDQFKKMIDFLGGVNVEVQRSFTDKKYPIEGKENAACDGDLEYSCRYETIRFNKGQTHMNGEIALKYIRSRNSVGIEGSDFARNIRQQNLIDALKKKMLSFVKTWDVNQYAKLYDVVNSSILRDITNQQAILILKRMVLGKNFVQRSIEIPRDEFIVPSYEHYDSKYVLIPQDGDFSKIHAFVQNSF